METETEKTNSKKEKSYMQYATNFKKISTLKLINYIISIFLVLFILFIPIFKFSTVGDVLTLEAFNGNYEKYLTYIATLPPDALITGKVDTVGSFSFFNEFVKAINFTQLDVEYSIMGVVFLLFPLFTIIMGIVLIIVSIKGLCGTIGFFKNSEQAIMVEYSVIKKTGSDKEKKNFFKAQTLYSFIVFVISTIIFGKIYCAIFEDMYDSLIDITYWMSFKGFNIGFYIMAVVFVAYIVLSVMVKSEKNKIVANITKEEFLKEENNL